MNKHPIYRFFIAFLVGVLISLNIANPAYSQSVAACATNPVCAAEMGLARASIGTVGASSPFSLTPLTSAGAATVATIAALNYLKDSDMQQLRDQAISQAPSLYSGSITYYYGSPARPYNSSPFISNFSTKIRDGYLFAVVGSSEVYQCPTPQSSTSFCAVDPSSSSTSPSLSDSASTLPDSSILSQAAAAAAAAASDSLASKDYDSALAAAAAALASAGLVPPTASQADRNKAATAAAAAAASRDSAQSAKDAAAAAAAAKDPTNPANVKAGRINFVVYALQVFSTKFPFDFLYSPPVPTTFNCPSYTFFYYKFEFCFLVPLFIALRWIVTIGVAMKMIYTI